MLATRLRGPQIPVVISNVSVPYKQSRVATVNLAATWGVVGVLAYPLVNWPGAVFLKRAPLPPAQVAEDRGVERRVGRLAAWGSPKFLLRHRFDHLFARHGFAGLFLNR